MARTPHSNRTDRLGHESAASCRAVESILALVRLLARQAAHEFLEHASSDGARHAKTVTAGIPACMEGADDEAKD